MANNGIFYTSGNTLDFTTTGTTWARLSSGGTFSSFGISATTYYNLPFSGTVVGSGTTNFVPLWTGSTGLSNSIIRANNTNVSINTSIDSNTLLSMFFTGTTGISSIASGYGIYGLSTSSTGFGVYGLNNFGGGNGAGVVGDMLDGTGVYGNSTGEFGPNIGVKGIATGSNGGTPENIGGWFSSLGDGTKYSVQLVDGTEDIGKVLVSQTSDGKANWSGELNITGVTATTISAITITSTDLIVNNSFQFITPSYYDQIRSYNNLVIFDANSLVTPISNEGFGGDENLVSGSVFLTLSNDSDSRAIEILYTLRSTDDDNFRSGKIIANWDRTYTNFYQTEYGPNYDLTTMTFIDPPRVFYGGSGTVIRVKIDFDDVTNPVNLLTARFKYTLI